MGKARTVPTPNRHELRRLREIEDGIGHPVASWPMTFSKLVAWGYAIPVDYNEAFVRITDAGRAALKQESP